MKRYIRIDVEYESTDGPLFTTVENLKRIIREDMPYCKILFSRDAPKLEDLDKNVFRR